MSVKMTAQFDITFDGVFDNCYIGCDSCDFITNTHTKYKDGKATGMELKVECQNADDYCSYGERKDDDKSCDTCKHHDKGWDDIVCDGCTKAHSNWERRDNE